MIQKSIRKARRMRVHPTGFHSNRSYYENTFILPDIARICKGVILMALTRISGYGHVALEYGLEESIFLESIMYWWRTNKANGRNFYDGRYWTYNTIKALAEIFPWWSAKQVRRIADSCRDKGALLIGNYNEDGRDRTIWYSPSDTLLALYGETPVEPQEDAPTMGSDDATGAESNCPNGQMHLPEQAHSFAQTGTALPCSYHVVTGNTPYSPPEGDSDPPEQPKPKSRRNPLEPYKPEWFESFWKLYPRKDGKKAARKAWDKLQPSYETCIAMLAALEAAKTSPQWTKDGGQFIPHASTWINGERWEDAGIDLAQLPQSVQSAVQSWTPDPEVIT